MMEELNFRPHKSKEAFRNNYKLHDLAETVGKNLLVQWGIDFKPFGEDNRFTRVWEKGDDKPDVIISYQGKEALLDWKGKHSEKWLMNKRAAISYQNWGKKFSIPVFICYVIFSSDNVMQEVRFVNLAFHKYEDAKEKAWDKNEVVILVDDPPLFTKANLLKYWK